MGCQLSVPPLQSAVQNVKTAHLVIKRIIRNLHIDPSIGRDLQQLGAGVEETRNKDLVTTSFSATEEVFKA